MKRDRDYWKLGITIFASLSATVCFFFLIFRFGEIRAALGIIRSALQPLFVGIALAYVLCPIEKRLEWLFKRAKGLARFARPISVLLTMIAALAVLVLFCALVVPQLVDSISGLVRDLPRACRT